jgi:predicted nucleic acid-binding protein
VTYLVDSDWVAEYLKGRSPAFDVLPKLAEEGAAISSITYGEIYDGIYSGRNAVAHERDFTKVLRFIDVVPLTRTIMKRFARLRGSLRRQGLLIPDRDLLIAATALHHDLVLVTRNIRHFDRVSDLRLCPLR